MVAVVVHVPMADDRVVQPFQSGAFLECGQNPLSVASVVVGIARVNQQRLARRGDDEGGGAAFDIDEPDVQRSIGLTRDRGMQRGQADENCNQFLHGMLLPGWWKSALSPIGPGVPTGIVSGPCGRGPKEKGGRPKPAPSEF